MPEKMSKTDAVLYAITIADATISECLKLQMAGKPPRREWLLTVGATLDAARAEIERLRGEARQ